MWEAERQGYQRAEGQPTAHDQQKDRKTCRDLAGRSNPRLCPCFAVAGMRAVARPIGATYSVFL